MTVKKLWVASILGVMTVAGCGSGGNAPTGKSTATSKATAKARVVATCRLEQAEFAVVGLGRPITRTANPRLGLLGLIPLIRSTRRDVTQGQDSSTKLYYTRTTNADGSGTLALFLDASRTSTAGNLSWVQPQWNNGQANAYPATIHSTYQITAGQFAGIRGTLDNTTQDVTGNNEVLHLVLTDAQNETVTSDFKVVNGVLSGKTNGTLSDGSTFTGSDSIGSNGILQFLINFTDGSQEDLSVQPDGTGTESYDTNTGSNEASSNFTDTGDDTIDYSDGSSETVNVDDSSDTSDTSS